MENQPQLFISHVRADTSFVERLSKDLFSQGFQPWFDENNLRPGEEWEKTIQDVIQSSRDCIFVLSPGAAENRTILQEYAIARQAGKRILPIILSPMVVPDEFSSLQEIDFSEGKYAEGFRQLLDALNPRQPPPVMSKVGPLKKIPAARPKKAREVENVQFAAIQRGGMEIQISNAQHGWELPVDGLVVPLTASGPGGELYLALLEGLGKTAGTDLDHRILGTLSSANASGSTPETVVMELPPSLRDTVLPNNPEGTGWIILVSFSNPSSTDWHENVNLSIKNVLSTASTLNRRLAIPLFVPEDGNGPAAGTVANWMVDALFENGSMGILKSVTLLTKSAEIVQQMSIRFNQIKNNRPQRLLNDKPGKDLLGIATEIEALTDAVLLRDCEPPIAVGVMGGWGTGKSTVMELMFQRIVALRTMRIENGWPGAEDKNPPDYVGHIYPIMFNAWTYAKSNLWASLMNTIFYDLNRQMTLEKVLAMFDPPMEDNLYVRAIYNPDYQFDPQSLPEPKKEEALSLLNNSILWRNLRSYKNMQFNALLDTESELAAAKARREETSSQQQKQAGEDLTRRIYFNILGERILAIGKDVLSQEVKDLLVNYLKNKAAADAPDKKTEEELEKALIELRSITATVKTIWNSLTTNLSTNWVNAAFLVLFLLIGWIGAAWIETAFKLTTGLDTLVEALCALVSGSLPLIRTAAIWSKRVDEKIREGQGLAQNQLQNLPTMEQKWLEKKRAQEEEQVAQELQKLSTSKDGPVTPEKKQEKLKELAKGGSLAAHDQLIALLELKASEQRRQAGPTAHHQTLLDFVRSRLDDGLYENQLGLMHQVENDIEELTAGLHIRDGDSPAQIEAKKKLFPRGIPRVVLFIDDLDRCPPQRVVEVLEAIQLLLKSELFVVVVGLDTRYVTLALEKEYKEILRHEGDPSGLDYIEKIIQIPYRVRPINPESLGKYLNAQMDILQEEVATPVPAVDKPAGTAGTSSVKKSRKKQAQPVPASTTTEVKPPANLPPGVVKFKPEDYSDLLNCCQVAALTPRSVKRLVNVLKLIKIFWFRRDETEPRRAVKQCVMALLALSAAYPEIMRDAMVRLESACGDPALAGMKVMAWLSAYQPSLTAGNVLDEQRANLTRDIQGFNKLNLGDVALLDLQRATLNLVRSFSFIGDPIGETDPLRVTMQEN